MKKEGWGGGGTRNVTFVRGQGDVAALKAGGKTLTVSIGDGLPRNASECQGAWGVVVVAGGDDKSTGAAGHGRRLGDIGVSQGVPQPCGVCVSPRRDPLLLGGWGSMGPFGGKRATGYKLRGQPPPQPALRTIT